MSWWYPSPERFDVTYDDEGRAYVTMEGRRFGVQRSHLNVDWALEPVCDYLYRGSRIRLELDLIELYEPPPSKKPKRSWDTSMGLRRPS
ncbi:Uncharacterised protein [Mycobacteroides abscessus subsp. massiliense]|nr:Uncharacterised protein [Mycobacteroides abscessus subsp. massiliense]